MKNIEKYKWHDLRDSQKDLPELEVGNEYVEVLCMDCKIPIAIQFDDTDQEFGYYHDIYDPYTLGFIDSEFKKWTGEDIVFWRYIEYPDVEEW